MRRFGRIIAKVRLRWLLAGMILLLINGGIGSWSFFIANSVVVSPIMRRLRRVMIAGWLSARLMDPGVIEDIAVRHFDGAVSWTYLDD